MGGILLGYLASALWVGETGGWRYMYGASLLPAIALLAGMVSAGTTSGIRSVASCKSARKRCAVHWKSTVVQKKRAGLGLLR